MNDIAIIVTTFLRDNSLFRAVDSIRGVYPEIDIIVADNGLRSEEKDDFLASRNCGYVLTSFDAGISKTRNAGVALLKEGHKYFVLIEDDMGFSADTSLERWREVLDREPAVGVVGGMCSEVYERRMVEQHYEFKLEVENATLSVLSCGEPAWLDAGGTPYALVDVVLNAFMARREVPAACPWDERFTAAPEHLDWFLNLKYRSGWKVAYAPSVSLLHFRDEETQRASRTGRTSQMGLLGKKWGVTHYFNPSFLLHQRPVPISGAAG
jgi:GT2 family glycosyltransferase